MAGQPSLRIPVGLRGRACPQGADTSEGHGSLQRLGSAPRCCVGAPLSFQSCVPPPTPHTPVPVPGPPQTGLIDDSGGLWLPQAYFMMSLGSFGRGKESLLTS